MRKYHKLYDRKSAPSTRKAKRRPAAKRNPHRGVSDATVISRATAIKGYARELGPLGARALQMSIDDVELLADPREYEFAIEEFGSKYPGWEVGDFQLLLTQLREANPTTRKAKRRPAAKKNPYVRIRDADIEKIRAIEGVTNVRKDRAGLVITTSFTEYGLELLATVRPAPRGGWYWQRRDSSNALISDGVENDVVSAAKAGVPKWSAKNPRRRNPRYEVDLRMRPGLDEDTTIITGEVQSRENNPCPKCKARAGKPCRTATGNPCGKPHAARANPYVTHPRTGKRVKVEEEEVERLPPGPISEAQGMPYEHMTSGSMRGYIMQGGRVHTRADGTDKNPKIRQFLRKNPGCDEFWELQHAGRVDRYYDTADAAMAEYEKRVLEAGGPEPSSDGPRLIWVRRHVKEDVLSPNEFFSHPVRMWDRTQGDGAWDTWEGGHQIKRALPPWKNPKKKRKAAKKKGARAKRSSSSSGTTKKAAEPTIGKPHAARANPDRGARRADMARLVAMAKERGIRTLGSDVDIISRAHRLEEPIIPWDEIADRMDERAQEAAPGSTFARRGLLAGGDPKKNPKKKKAKKKPARKKVAKKKVAKKKAVEPTIGKPTKGKPIMVGVPGRQDYNIRVSFGGKQQGKDVYFAHIIDASGSVLDGEKKGRMGPYEDPDDAARMATIVVSAITGAADAMEAAENPGLEKKLRADARRAYARKNGILASTIAGKGTFLGDIIGGAGLTDPTQGVEAPPVDLQRIAGLPQQDPGASFRLGYYYGIIRGFDYCKWCVSPLHAWERWKFQRLFRQKLIDASNELAQSALQGKVGRTGRVQ